MGYLMSELNDNRVEESYDELQATADELMEFKKQYDAMTSQEKARLPTWLLEYFQQG